MPLPTIALALLAAAEPAPLVPIGQWQMGHAEGACVMTHDFGNAEVPTTIGFKPALLGPEIEVALVTPGTLSQPRAGKVRILLEPSGATIERTATQVQVRGEARVNVRLPLDATAAPLLEDATAITITVGKASTRVPLPDIKPALATLRKCKGELLVGWGVDPTERDRVDPNKLPRVAPSAAKGDWVRSSDYPAGLDHSQWAVVIVLWTIGLDGRVHDCRAIESSGFPAFDKATCDALTVRGAYTPAIDKSGKPMLFHATRRVVWH